MDEVIDEQLSKELHKILPLKILGNLTRRWLKVRDTNYTLRWYDAWHLADAMASILERATPEEMAMIERLLQSKEPTK